jgi:hypothetical protein
MEQKTFYAIVGPDNKFLLCDFNVKWEEWEYSWDDIPDLYTQDMLKFAQQKAAEKGGTVKRVTITIEED